MAQYTGVPLRALPGVVEIDSVSYSSLPALSMPGFSLPIDGIVLSVSLDVRSAATANLDVRSAATVDLEV